MPVGDEYFLSSLHPHAGKDHIVNWEITYDNWEDVHTEVDKLQDNIRQLYEHMETTGEDVKEKIEQLQIYRDTIRKNPRTYHTLQPEDIARAKKTDSFFWRKFTIMPLPWTYLPK
jgi:hypothetical protein